MFLKPIRSALVAATGLFFLLSQVGPALAQVATDRTPFGVAVTSPQANTTVSGSVTLKAQTSGGASGVSFSLNGTTLQATATDSALTLWQATWDTSRGSDGQYQITASAASGNLSAVSAAVSVTVANQAPTQNQTTTPAAAVSSPKEGDKVSGSSVPFSAQTTVAVSQLSFVISGGSGPAATLQATGDAAGMAWSASWNATTFPDGQYSVVAQAASASAASSTSTFSSPTVIFEVDNPEPFTAAVGAPAAGQVLSGSATFTAATSAAGSELTFVVSGGDRAAPLLFVAVPDSSFMNWSATWDTTTLANGTAYSVYAKAKRSDGFEALSQTKTFAINNATEPAFTVGIDSPSSASSVVGIVELKATTSVSASSVSFKMTGGPNNISSTFLAVPDAAKTKWVAQWDSKSVADGTYSLTAMASRASGTGATSTVQSATITVAVNNPKEAPLTVTIVEPASTASLKETASFKATTSAAADSLSFLVSTSNAVIVATLLAVPDATKTGWSVTWDTKTVANGTYTFVAKAAKSGVTVVVGPRTIAINNASAPTTMVATLVSPQSAASISGSVEVKVTTDIAADGVQVIISRDANATPIMFAMTGDAEKKTWTAVWDTTKTVNGTYSLYARAVKGTLSTATAAITAAVNNATETALAVTLAAPGSGAALSGITTLKATTSLVSDTVKFSITSAAGTVIIVDGVPDSTGKNWSANWNSAASADGTYLVKAGAIRGTSKAETPSVNVTVANKAAAEVKLAVTIHEPAPQSVVSGAVNFRIATTAASDKVTITIIAAATSSIVTKFDATADATRMAWTGAWDSTKSPDASYRVSALAVKSGSSAEAAVAIGVKNQQTAPTPTEPPPEVKPALSVVVSHPPDASELRGNVTLAAKTLGNAIKVSFVIYAAGVDQPLQTKDASWSAANGAWGAIWDTSRHPDGKYVIVGAALNAAGERAQSATVRVSTANAIKEGPTDATAPVVVIPREVIVDSVKEVPEGTKPLIDEGTTQTDSLNDRSKESSGGLALDPECAAAGVPGDKCEEYLSFRHRSDECRQAGIITKEECVNYLSLRGGGQLSECAALSQEECDILISKKTAGLLSTEQLDKLEDALIFRIGGVVKFGPAGLAVEGSKDVSEQDKLIIESVPLVTRKELSLRIHASPSYGEADGLSFKQAAAVLMIDSDGDGLPDDTEGRLGTDPKDADSDDDGYSDWTEVKNGYNPLGDGKLRSDTEYAPIDRAIVAGSPIEQPKSGGETDEGLKVDDVIIGEDPDAPSTKLQGKAKPGTTVTIYVYSYLPIVLTTTADESGNWSYELDSTLSDGEHEAYVTVTDDTGKIQAKSNPLAFFVSAAQAAEPSDYFGNQAVSSVSAEAPVQQVFQWYGFAAAGLILFALIIIGLIVLRKMKKPGATGT